MRRILIVANRTVLETHVLQRLADYVAEEPCYFYLLIPGGAPAVSYGGGTTRRSSRAAAGKHMWETLSFLHDMGAEAAGRVTDLAPLIAISELLADEPFDEIVLATAPPGASYGWLGDDVPHDVARSFDVPVTQVSGWT